MYNFEDGGVVGEIMTEGGCSLAGGLSSRCTLVIGRSGEIDVTTRLDLCSQPLGLAIGLQTSLGMWRNFFHSHNAHDSRLVGPEFWPMLLHVYFVRLLQDVMTYRIKVCIEALKTDEWICFVNETISYDVGTNCDHMGDNIRRSTILTSCIGAIVLCVVIATLVSSAVIWYKRQQRLKLLSNRIGPSLPHLPGAIPYKDSGVLEPLNKSLVEPDPPPLSPYKQLEPVENGFASFNTSTETKSIQTSTTSLEDSNDCGSSSSHGAHRLTTSTESSV